MAGDLSALREELRGLLEKASLLPWHYDRGRSMGGAPILVGMRRDRNRMREVVKVLFDNGSDDPEVHANARLVEKAVTSLPALLSALDRADRLEEALRKICEPITVAADADTVSACQDLHELICDIAQAALEDAQ